MAVMVMRSCDKIEGGLPSSVRSKMMFNIMLDFLIGLVPFLGDLADAVFRANTRNAVELERYLREKGARNLKAQGQTAGGVIDPSDPDEFDRQMIAEHGPPPQYDSRRQGTAPEVSATAGPQQPVASSTQEQRSGGGGGFFSKKKQRDVEQGTGMATRNNDPLPTLPNDGPERQKSTLRKDRR